MTLPESTREAIYVEARRFAEAEAARDDQAPALERIKKKQAIEYGYEAGATEWAERAQELYEEARRLENALWEVENLMLAGGLRWERVARARLETALAPYREAESQQEAGPRIGTLDTFFDALKRRADEEAERQ